MWLATKQAAARRKPKSKQPPADVILHSELGVPGAIDYRRLVEKFPDVELGPDETISDHYSRLRAANESWLADNALAIDEMRPPPRARRRPERGEGTAGWLQMRKEDQIARFPSTLPRRDPGWYTSPDSSSRGYGAPPMSQRRRTPGVSLVSPKHEPPQQSVGDWVRWLADKGIYLTPDGQRMTSEDMALPRRPLRGQQIWGPFTRPASVILSSRGYPDYHRKMVDDGWAFHGDGGYFGDDAGNFHPNNGPGSRYQMDIGDKTHIIVRDGGGWVHNSGPTGEVEEEYGDPVMTGSPMFFDRLGDAVLHAKTDKVHAGFSTKPPSIQRLNSWEVSR